MSYWAAYSGQGLILDSQEFNEFLEMYEKVAGKDDPAVKQLEEYVEGNIGVEEINFTKPGTKETFEFHTADDGCCEGFRLWPYRIDGMNCFDERPYESYDAFVQEFKDKMAAYLWDSFDWDAHIGIYSYACFA